MTITTILDKAEKELPELIEDLVWAATDGGQRIEKSRFISYREEPVREFEEIQAFIRTSIQSLLEDIEKEIGEARGQDPLLEEVISKYKK